MVVACLWAWVSGFGFGHQAKVGKVGSNGRKGADGGFIAHQYLSWADGWSLSRCMALGYVYRKSAVNWIVLGRWMEPRSDDGYGMNTEAGCDTVGMLP